MQAVLLDGSGRHARGREMAAWPRRIARTDLVEWRDPHGGDCVNFSAVLLVGGASRRMGRDKSTLYWNGTSLLVHQAGILRQTGAQQFLLSGRVEQMPMVDGF